MPGILRARRAMLSILSVALLLATAACDDATEPVFDARGVLRFDYSGTATGSFHAVGELPVDASGLPTTIPTSGAVAVLRQGALMIVGARSTGSQTGDVIAMQIGAFNGPGSYTMNALSCDPNAPATCRVGGLAFAVSLQQIRQAAELGSPLVDGFVIGLGTVNVTERTTTRIRGTFSVLAAGPPSVGFASVTISNGQFDLPLRVIQ